MEPVQQQQQQQQQQQTFKMPITRFSFVRLYAQFFIVHHQKKNPFHIFCFSCRVEAIKHDFILYINMLVNINPC